MVRSVEELPRRRRGKIDYDALPERRDARSTRCSGASAVRLRQAREASALLLGALNAAHRAPSRGLPAVRPHPRPCSAPPRHGRDARRRAVAAGRPVQDARAASASPTSERVQDAHLERHHRPGAEPHLPRSGRRRGGRRAPSPHHDSRARPAPPADDHRRHARPDRRPAESQRPGRRHARHDELRARPLLRARRRHAARPRRPARASSRSTRASRCSSSASRSWSGSYFLEALAAGGVDLSQRHPRPQRRLEEAGRRGGRHATFKRRLASASAYRVHNFYGMVEQVGSVYLECDARACSTRPPSPT